MCVYIYILSLFSFVDFEETSANSELRHHAAAVSPN